MSSRKEELSRPATQGLYSSLGTAAGAQTLMRHCRVLLPCWGQHETYQSQASAIARMHICTPPG